MTSRLLRPGHVLVVAEDGDVFAIENHDGRAHLRRLTPDEAIPEPFALHEQTRKRGSA